MSEAFSQILITFTLGLLLVACSSGPELCTPNYNIKVPEGVTLAPKKATSRPYQIKGEWYYPQHHYEYDAVGIASYYGGGDIFHGRPTATGEIFDKNGLTGAHKTLPLPCIVVVTNLENGRQIQVKVNDRGPFIEGRFFDASRRVAQLLGFEGKGTARVRVQTLVSESLALNGIDSSAVMLAQALPPLPLEGSSLSEPMPSAVIPAAFIEANLAAAEPPSIPDAFIDAHIDAPALMASTPPPSVSPPAIPSPAPSAKGIFVHVGGYDSHERAHAFSKSLDGVTSSPVVFVKNNGPEPYTVQLGPLLSMSQANQVLDQLMSAGHLMSRIVILR